MQLCRRVWDSQRHSTVKLLLDASTLPISAATLATPALQSFIADDVAAPTGRVSAVYAFGDSLSDAGNIFVTALGLFRVGGVYSDGRFSNDDVWVQDLSQNLSLPAVTANLAGGTDHAHGGGRDRNDIGACRRWKS